MNCIKIITRDPLKLQKLGAGSAHEKNGFVRNYKNEDIMCRVSENEDIFDTVIQYGLQTTYITIWKSWLIRMLDRLVITHRK